MKTNDAFLLAFLALMPAVVTADPGDFDTAFGTDGATTVSSNGLDLVGYCLAQDDSGNIVVAGSSGDADDSNDLDPMLALVNSSGSERDTYMDGPGGEEYFTSCGFDSQNRLYAIGSTNDNGTHDVFIMRFRAITEAQFELDTTFQSGGTVITDLNSGSADDVMGARIDSQDRIVVGGVTDTGGPNDLFVARYTSSGNLDTTFGSSGRTITDLNVSDAIAWDFALGQNDEAAVVGQSGSDFLIAVYDNDGNLETGFDSDGLATVDLGSTDIASTVAFDGNDLIVAGRTDASGSGDVAVIRYDYNANSGLWTRDLSFGGDGVADFSVGTATTDTVLGITVDSEGRILLTGSSQGSAATSAFVARLEADGSLDTGFGDNGVALWSDPSESGGMDVLATSDGDVLIGGYAVLGSQSAFVARVDNSDSEAGAGAAACGLAMRSAEWSTATSWQGVVYLSLLLALRILAKRRGNARNSPA